MADVDRLLAEYKEAHRDSGGDADPRPFLARASGPDRTVLSALIEAYLERAPRRELDSAAFTGSPSALLAEQVERSLAGESGMWPAILPRLRSRARLRRSDLVAQLAARLGASAQQEKVGAYYHQMEQGLLPAAGVSETVLDALGKIVGWSADALRRAGEMPAAGPPRADAGAVFARTTRAGAPMPAAEVPESSLAGDWDEVDRLFRGEPPSA